MFPEFALNVPCTPFQERYDILRQFEASEEPVLIASARALQEGVDLPALDMVVLMDCKRSELDIVQTVGRAIRPGTISHIQYPNVDPNSNP